MSKRTLDDVTSDSKESLIVFYNNDNDIANENVAQQILNVDFQLIQQQDEILEPPSKTIKLEENVDPVEENNVEQDSSNVNQESTAIDRESSSVDPKSPNGIILIDKCIQVEEEDIDKEQQENFVILNCEQSANCQLSSSNNSDYENQQDSVDDFDENQGEEEIDNDDDDDDDQDFIIEDEEESDDSERLVLPNDSDEEEDDEDEIEEEEELAYDQDDNQNVLVVEQSECQPEQQSTKNFDQTTNVISTDSGESSSTITSTISNDVKKINSSVECETDNPHCYQIIVDGQVDDVVDEGEATNTEIEFNDENSSSSSSGVLSIANSLEDNTTVSSISSESGQLRGLLKVETKPKHKKKVIFNDVTVFYFKRSQGFTCVPSQGGSTLGMENTHSYLKNFTLESHAEERKRAHREILIRQKRFAKINKQSSTSESEDESYDDFSDLSDTDLENDSCYFLQPVPIKQRRALLRASGVRKIETREKEECRNIRMSREFCGCDCRVYCNPEVCSCHLAGIKCQVDRMSFPCGCTREGCANTNGRIEFNPLRVRTHFIHTIMRLEMEKKKQNPQQPNPMNDPHAHTHQEQHQQHQYHHQKNMVDGYLPTTSNGPTYDSTGSVQISPEQQQQQVIYHSTINTDHHYLSSIHQQNQMIPHHQHHHNNYEMPMSSTNHHHHHTHPHHQIAITEHTGYTSSIMNTVNCAIDQQQHHHVHHQMFIANQAEAGENPNDQNEEDDDFEYDSQDNNSSYSENSDYTNTSADDCFDGDEHRQQLQSIHLQQDQHLNQFSSSSNSSNYSQIQSISSNSTTATVLPSFPSINDFNKPQQEHCHLQQQTYQSSNLNHLSYNNDHHSPFGEQSQQTYYDHHHHQQQQYEYEQQTFHMDHNLNHHQFSVDSNDQIQHATTSVESTTTVSDQNIEQTSQQQEYIQPLSLSIDISLSMSPSVNILTSSTTTNNENDDETDLYNQENNQASDSSSNNVYQNINNDKENELQQKSSSNNDQLIYETVTYDMATQIDGTEQEKNDKLQEQGQLEEIEACQENVDDIAEEELEEAAKCENNQSTHGNEDVVHEVNTNVIDNNNDDGDEIQESNNISIKSDVPLDLPIKNNSTNESTCHENSSSNNNENFSDIMKQSMVETAQA